MTCKKRLVPFSYADFFPLMIRRLHTPSPLLRDTITLVNASHSQPDPPSWLKAFFVFFKIIEMAFPFPIISSSMSQNSTSILFRSRFSPYLVTRPLLLPSLSDSFFARTAPPPDVRIPERSLPLHETPPPLSSTREELA